MVPLKIQGVRVTFPYLSAVK